MSEQLSVERTGTRRGIARNARGGEVRYGPVEEEGAFTPGELLQLALAACHLMSADHTLARRLGADVELVGTVEARKDTAANRYLDAQVRIAVDGGALDALDEQARAELRGVVARAVERSCTVGRTLEAGMPHTLELAQG